ncbi:MAG: hypothetical protein IJR86_05170 [Bacteroidaceae bacterium]|nr:hypothetical protein [Bacteroidaceae bacterium]
MKKLYPELEGDDLMDEVFQHFAGKRGAERLREEQRKQEEAAKDKSMLDNIKAAFKAIRKTLKEFWQQARDLFAGNNKNLANLSAEDFADMMLNDLLNGYKPQSNAKGVKFAKSTQTQDNPFVTNRKAKELVNMFRTWTLEEMGETVENYVFNHPTIKEALGNREASDIYDYLTTLNEKEYKRLTSGRFYYPVPSYDDFLSMDKEEAIDEVDEFKELVIDNFINDRMTDVDWVKKNMPELVNSVRFDEDTTPTGEARKALGVDEETGIDTGSAYIDEDALENANKGVMFSKKDKTSYAPTGIARSRFSKAEIQVSPSEYAQISHQIETYPNKKFRGLVFTANNFYLCDVKGAGDFRVLMEMPIEGNEDLIDYIHKNYGKNNSRIVESNADIDGRLQDARLSSRSRVSNNSSVEREQFSNSRLGGVDTSSEANGRRGDAKTVRTLEGQSEVNNAAMTEAANSAAEELHTPVTVIGTEEELDAQTSLTDAGKKSQPETKRHNQAIDKDVTRSLAKYTIQFLALQFAHAVPCR